MPPGLYVLPHPEAMQDAAADRSGSLRRLFGLLRAAFNTVVIDTSKGLQASDFMAFEMSDVILVVVQLDLVCLRNTARLLGLFREFEGIGRPGQAGREPVGLARMGDQSEEGRRDLENADLVAGPQRGQGRSRRRGSKGCRSLKSPREAGPTRCSSRSPARCGRPRTESPSKPRRGLFAALF